MKCLFETILLTLQHWINGGNAIVEGHVYQDQEKIDAWVITGKCIECGKETWSWVRKDDPLSLNFSSPTKEGEKE